ncbi:3'-5' exoribonuclease YhaM family protein [Liquorilactobacillus satsumensis]|uniref:CMP-binding factor n=1 Tax=Liquorilactobacillus satsumensis DSM 16230 = JCM 12392 TaxID=1423801 RepID=A0A0R1V216_9LACO|nr:HD domain-containing protein [Liquorilactobacillus satsumensis]KRL99689.1 CMP-binding factor [Liquorilactobacillus satsumensis DSM 16230 = JCM 12392]MCC7665694.1 3'-5' exonuclease [Liquorilactobacillus satsumensis]MCP9313630.1 HD domain-containing protein [Liquorilactobacillus satsumensis]MCP9328294.1 HD domain-containing protein [Liquorilactobacillus satsumensis]MCP9356513.1 HD domain-containing protein [Liquorilactobacillus satsumensis]
MSHKKIYEYAVDENMELFVLIKSADVRVAKNGNQFIAFNFSDSSGEISAKFWDASPADTAAYQPGKIVLLKGKREIYQGNPQIKIYRMRLVKEGEPNDPSLFVQKAPVSKNAMEAEFNQAIFEITNPNWNRIVRFLLKKHQEDFFSYPAAKKNHHAFAGGLAFHTLSMLRLAHAVAHEYQEINAPLLYAATILHDLGKTIELSGPVATQYTLAGNLVGHIVLIDEEVVKAAGQLKISLESEDMLLLRHMLLAHHGLLEYGSPVRPHLLEAEVLHQIDQLDASIQMLKGTLSHTQPGTFSERIFGMDGRNFYKPLAETEQPEQE